MVPVSYNVRSLFVRKTTTIATATGIALVVFVLASALMLSAGIKRTMKSSGKDSNAHVIRKGSGNELSSSFENKLVGIVASGPGVKKDAAGKPLASGEVVVVIALNKKDNPEFVSNVQLRGVSENVFAVRPEVKVIEGRPPKPGTDEVMVGKQIRGSYQGVDLGQKFELKKNRSADVVGIFEASGSSLESEIWGDTETVRTSFGREGIVSAVTVVLDSRNGFDAFKAYVESDKQINLEAERENIYYEKQSEGTSIFISAIGIVISVFFSLGAIIGAVITMYAAVSQRQREIGTLLAIGFSRFSILTSFLLESIVLTFIGGAFGAVASIGMSAVHLSMMNFATWQEVTFSFDPEPKIIVISLVVGAVMGVLGGFFPAVRAARLSPIDAIRGG